MKANQFTADMIGDDLQRFIFAGYLEKHGDPRAELLRLTHSLTQSSVVPNRPLLETRLRGLLNEGVEPIGPFWTNSIGMKFALIPAGTFLMGSPIQEDERDEDEVQHKVALTKGFYLSVFTVTQEEWQAVMGSNPTNSKRERNLPVDQVSWNDCQEFITKLREKDERAYRLPFEAEWEYACRAGTTTPYSFGETISTDQANYDGNDTYPNGEKAFPRQRITPVGSFPANAFGLHDMHGNVWEWCQDWLGDYPQNEVVDPQGPDAGKYRVLRGGSCISDAKSCRSAYRSWHDPDLVGELCGFRVCFCLN